MNKDCKKMIGFFLVMVFSLISLAGCKTVSDKFVLQRENMVKYQIQARGVEDPKVIAAMKKVKRHLFVPLIVGSMSYTDQPLPIGYRQTISQPFIVAYMTQALKLSGDERVLEIGTGSGYQSAVLAEIAKEVYTIEIVQGLAYSAGERLKKLGYDNISILWGDGYKGWPEYAPFDAIIVTAAPGGIPPELVKQLKPGGRMVIPVGNLFQQLYLITKTKSGIEKKELIPVRFVPMVESEK